MGETKITGLTDLQRPGFVIKLRGKYLKEEFFMLKMLAKLAERYAKATNTACFVMGMFINQKCLHL